MNKHIITAGIIGTLTLLLFVVTTHTTQAAPQTLADLFDLASKYINYGIAMIVSLAVLVFVWGIYNQFIKVDADRTEAGMYVLYAIGGFFIIISLWGIVNIVINTFQLQSVTGLPQIHTTGGAGTVSGGGTTVTGGSQGSSSSGFNVDDSKNGVGAIDPNKGFLDGGGAGN